MNSNNKKSVTNQYCTIENNIIKSVQKIYDIKEKTIGEFLLNIFNANLDHVGQIEGETGTKVTFKEMKDNIIRCALWMQKQGIKNGDVISMALPILIDIYIPFLANFFIGTAINPWFHEQTLKSARYFFNLIKPKLMFCTESNIDILIKAAKLENINVKFISFEKNTEAESLYDILKSQKTEEVDAFLIPEINPQDIALILFSSGSTGLPKGVLHSYNSLLMNILNFACNDYEKCIQICHASLYWISGTLFFLQGILTVSTNITHTKFDVEQTLKYIEKYKITHTFSTPRLLVPIYKSNSLKKYDLSSLKVVTTTGAKLSSKIIDEFTKALNISIFQGYGMTEFGGFATIQTSDCKSIKSVGFPIPNMQLKVVDLINKQPLGPNKPGELYLKSDTQMVGYINNPIATKETVDDEGWIHTGDLVYYDENAEFFIIDRIKETMKIFGHHVSPTELEEAIISHPAVMEVAVVGIPNQLSIHEPIAFVKKNFGWEVTEDELIKITDELGKFKRLSGGVKFLNELPHTASGKLNRKEIKEMAKAYVK